jgi:membrane protease YdiL (CAAX protease family)
MSDNSGDCMEASVGSETQNRNLPMSKLIWTLSLLILATWALDGLGSHLLLNVFRRRELTSYWPSLLVRQAFLIAMTLFSTELAVVLFFYRPLKIFFTLSPIDNSENQARHKLAIGVAGGVCAFLASIPLLFSGDPVHIITPQLLSYPVSLSVVCQIGMLLVVVPFLSELVFRGIVFRSLRAASGFWPAAIGSSVLFACVWSIPTAPVMVILGVASALVFRKTRTLGPSIMTNATLAILVETFFVLHDLHLF